MVGSFEKWEGLGNDFVIIEVAGEHEWLEEARVRVQTACSSSSVHRPVASRMDA